MHLVMLETSGNQDFIFASSRLIEVVGASVLVHQAGTKFVLEAIAGLGGPAGLWDDNPDAMAENLTDPSKNPPIESGSSFEVVQAASGKALVLCANRDLAQQLVRAVSVTALVEAPGLQLVAAISPAFDFDTGNFVEINADIHESGMAAAKASAPPSTTRFGQLPIVAQCATHALPSARSHRIGRNESFADRSMAAIVKSDVGNQIALGRSRHDGRMDVLVAGAEAPIVRNHTQLEELLDTPWLAVIHADTNDAGKAFTEAATKLASRPNREAINTLRQMSLDLDAATRQALNSAARTLSARTTKKVDEGNDGDSEERWLPLLPLVVGGDDFTAIVDGRQSLNFAVTYLQVFAEETRKSSVLPSLDASLGVAVTKPHYPFLQGHRLAQDLVGGCKRFRRDGFATPGEASMLDFHVLFDSAAVTLEAVTARLHASLPPGPDKAPVTLRGGPFVINPLDERWKSRDFARVLERANSVNEVDQDGRRKLPASQVHRLREEILSDREAVERSFRRLCLTNPSAAELRISGTKAEPSLFQGSSRSGWRSDLLDVLAAGALVGGETS